MKNEEIIKYIKSGFDLYSMDSSFLYYRIGKNGILYKTSKINDGIVNDNLLKTATEMLGLTKEEICSRDENAKMRYYKKYKFFSLLKEYLDVWNAERNRIKNARKSEVLYIPSKCIWEEELVYNYASVEERLHAKLKEIDEVLPGTYHENAYMENLEIDTVEVFSYPRINEFLAEYLVIRERVEFLYYKILNGSLEKEEVSEYNFYVHALEINHRKKDGIPLTYNYVKENSETLKRYIFALDAYINLIMRIRPWQSIEFLKDEQLAKKFEKSDFNIGSKLLSFYKMATNFRCLFQWSNAGPYVLSLQQEIENAKEGRNTDVSKRIPMDTIVFIAKYPYEGTPCKEYLKQLEKYISENVSYEYLVEYKLPKNNNQRAFESTDPISQAIGKKLRKLIDENFENDHNFAKQFNISSRTLQRYKKDGITDTRLIMQLAEFFDVDWKFFFE